MTPEFSVDEVGESAEEESGVAIRAATSNGCRRGRRLRAAKIRRATMTPMMPP